jgi:C-terminal processing protease CtpA/Prc
LAETFSREVREAVLQTVIGTVQQRLYDPAFNGKNWLDLAAARTDAILATETPDAFVAAIRELVAELDVHPTDFFPEQSATVPFHRIARATLHPYQGRWMLQDVHADGPADRAGLEPGDQVEAIDGVRVRSDEPVTASPSCTARVSVIKRDGARADVDLVPQTPAQRASTRYVMASKVTPDVGLLRVSQFPGLVGIEMAQAIDSGIRAVGGCERLIVDLRGNPGGGSANLRLMSYLTPGKMPVGYSLTRPRAQAGYNREDLAQFRAIPSSKLALIWLALRFKWVDKSIAVVTEGLGRQRFHGRIVLLVNEHTTSGAEIVVGFAREHRLATIVGSRTAGRLLGWSSLLVGHGFRLTLPVSNYITWEGRCFENTGITPDVEEPFRPEAALIGRDNQFEAATDVSRKL